ncbi:MAG TPA: hypothetical protein VGK71_08575 [Nitrospirota bacterium]
MRKFFPNSTKRSYEIGIWLGASHAIFSWMLILDIARQGTDIDAMWQMMWIPSWLIDFPFSLIDFVPVFSSGSISFLPYPMGEVRSFLVPAVVHGLIGPLWYFLASIWVSNLYQARKKRNV